MNMEKLKEQIAQKIIEIELKESTTNFCKLEKKKKISLDSEFIELGKKITVTTPAPNIFKKHLYDGLANLNNEETNLAESIDQCENVEWWYRSVEKDLDNGLYFQGWQPNRFWPDFIVKTKSGKFLVVEYKGENLKSNEDTKYKNQLGKKWEELTPKEFYFFIVIKKKTKEDKKLGFLDIQEFDKKLGNL